MKNVFLDGSPDPPNRVSGKAKASFRLIAVQCPHQSDVAFGDDFRHGQSVAPVTHRDFCGKTQMAGDDLVGCVAIAQLAPAFGKLILLVSLEHREAPDVGEIALTASLFNERW